MFLLTSWVHTGFGTMNSYRGDDMNNRVTELRPNYFELPVSQPELPIELKFTTFTIYSPLGNSAALRLFDLRCHCVPDELLWTTVIHIFPSVHTISVNEKYNFLVCNAKFYRVNSSFLTGFTHFYFFSCSERGDDKGFLKVKKSTRNPARNPRGFPGSSW